jgi:hypothetical protein
MVAAALIDRLVHHATMITLKGKSYRLRERGLDVTPAAQAPSLRDSASAAATSSTLPWCTFRLRKPAHFSAALDTCFWCFRQVPVLQRPRIVRLPEMKRRSCVMVFSSTAATFSSQKKHDLEDLTGLPGEWALSASSPPPAALTRYKM